MLIPIIIFSVALMTRCLLGYAFFGSIDVSAFIGITTHTFNGTLVNYPFSIWCSFPVIPFYTWFCGFLSIMTPLPLAFCFKIIPILFDSLLALLVYDFVALLRPEQALRAGMLYALCPVALLVTCIHGQWDSMPLLFLLLSFFVRDFYAPSMKNYFLYGLLFACAFMLKPMPLIFLLFFFVPLPGLKKALGAAWYVIQALASALAAMIFGFFIFFKCNETYSIDSMVTTLSTLHIVMLVAVITLVIAILTYLMLTSHQWRTITPRAFKTHLYRHLAALAGLACMTSLCLALLTLYGFHPIVMIDKVLRYFNQGIAVFGLPFAGACQQANVALILKNRFWIMGLIGCIAMIYYQQRIDLYRSLLLSLMTIFSFSGLSPQYLIWAAPLLLITGFYRASALFNALCTAFLVLYYMNPLSNPEVPYQNMLSFTPLKTLGWLMPPALLSDKGLLPIIALLGNYAIPLCCAAIGIVIVRDALCNKHIKPIKPVLAKPSYMYVAIALALTGLIGTIMLVYRNTSLACALRDTIAASMGAYDVLPVDGGYTGNYGSFMPFNIVIIITIFTLIWCIAALRVKQSPTRSLSNKISD